MLSATTNVVLVVVDMQNGFLGDRSRHVVPNVLRLVTLFRSLNRPVVFTQFRNTEGSGYERLIGWTRLRTSPETDITAELAPYADTVIAKTMYSAFTPAFDRLQQEYCWHTLLLCGVATDSCVLKTAVDAFERDLLPIVVADACASHAGTEIHNAGLALIGRFIGRNQITTVNEVEKSLTAAAAQPLG